MKAHKFQHETYREYVVKRKARTYHTCNECHGDIIPGEEYYADSFGYEHNPHRAGGKEYYTHKVCEDCWKGISLRARKLTRKDFEPDIEKCREDFEPDKE